MLSLLLITLISFAYGTVVDFDNRALKVDGERKLLISGSVHYPRAQASEWPGILSLAKANGINIIETYVFWSIHEPQPGVYNFPSDGSSDDMVEFIRECDKQGLYVHLRFGPYVCAEWNYGGFPVWLHDEAPDMTYRTYDEQWLSYMSNFVKATVKVVDDAKLLAKDGGPIIMAQIENEYGNWEASYGEKGAEYVQWSAEFAESLELEVPWVMCQQGEGNGTAPPANVINTCNGYYCDNWISRHAQDFPNQPHMFTENWPGWYQNWGDPVPHRPAVDVAFSVARWFARGGSYMNYYMAFGGTTFGRQVGGPLIITSYDYDVQINEYGLEAEPKYSLLTQLHNILLEYADVILQDNIPEAVSLTDVCESHRYTSDTQCLMFLSNFGVHESCQFVSDVEVEVPAWSVTVLGGVNCQEHLYNTKTSLQSVHMPAPNKVVYEAIPTEFRHMSVFEEEVPSSSTHDSRTSVRTISPLEQLSLTVDTTDYLWYSVNLTNKGAWAEEGVLSFTCGEAGGCILFAYVNGKYSGSTVYMQTEESNATLPSTSHMTRKSHKLATERQTGQRVQEPLQGVPMTDTHMKIVLQPGDNVVSLLSANMGLQNYGDFLEKMQTGIVSDLMYNGVAVHNVTHTVGLVGESLELFSESNAKVFKPLDKDSKDVNKPLRWYSARFNTPPSAGEEDTNGLLSLALDLGGSMGKGAVWVNGHMLGRYWNITSSASTYRCEDCESHPMDYVGEYVDTRCRTGCNTYSQRMYKLPFEWLTAGTNALNENGDNSLVIFEEVGGDPFEVQLMKVAMKEV